MADSVAVLYSGGLDGAILVAQLAEQGSTVHPLYIDSGLAWQSAELNASRKFCQGVANRNLRRLVVLCLPLADLYGDHWSVTGSGVPDADTPDEAVYLLGRNPLLLIKARLWCQLHAVGSLAIGCLGNNPFADATDQFFAQFAAALDQATDSQVRLIRPLSGMSKLQVMELGKHYPLEFTFSCISPVGDQHCGQCNKCAERKMAFARAGLNDPTLYAEGSHVPAPQVLSSAARRLQWSNAFKRTPTS